MNEDRLALAEKDANRFPVFKVKDKDTTFRQRFRVPLVKKSPADGYDPSRPAPILGMRRGTAFVVKPLHDPSGEFAIVLYDPTVDDVDENTEEEKQEEEQKDAPPKLDAPLVNKSIADILGLKKKVDTRPRVPVVIDPKLAKVLRPHQVEGVKVRPLLHVVAERYLVKLTCHAVSLSLYNRLGSEKCERLYHGR